MKKKLGNHVSRAGVVLACAVLGFTASAATRYWTGAAGDGMFFNPTNWNTKTASLAWADTLHFTNDAPITISTATFGAFQSQWPRYVYVKGANVIVKDGDFRLHGKGANPHAFFDIAEGTKLVVSNSVDHVTGDKIYVNNYNAGEVVKKGKGTLELWGRGASKGYEMAMVNGSLLHVKEGEMAIRSTAACGGYLSSSEVVVDEGAVLTLAGGYNSGSLTASWTINGTLQLYTGGGATACAALNGTGVITNAPWTSSTCTLTVNGSGGLQSAFNGTIGTPKVAFEANKETDANDGFFRIVRSDVFQNCGGLTLKGSGNPISFAAGLGTAYVSYLGVGSGATATLTLADLDGHPVTVDAEMTATGLQRLYTAGVGNLVVSGDETTTLCGSKLQHQGTLSVQRALWLGDGTSADNDFDFARGPRRIELHGTNNLTVNNVNAFSYSGTLAGEAGSWSFYTPGTIARVERNGGLTAGADLVINGGTLTNCYSLGISAGKTLTLSGVKASYSATTGLSFNNATGTRLIFNGDVFDVSAHDPAAPMYFEQRGGEVRFVGGRQYTPPSAATAENPATYLFAGGISRILGGSVTPFNSTALNLLAGASGAKLRDDEMSISSTAGVFVKSPFKSGVTASAVDGGIEIDARHWFRFLYPLEITGPFKLVGSGAMVEATASFADGTSFFGLGDIDLDTSEIAFFPRTGSKTVNLATGAGCKFLVKGSSLLSARYRDPNNGNTKDANHFVMSAPEFGDAGLLALVDRVATVGTDGASTVKLASGVPQMSASGRVLAPIVMGGKLANFTTYDDAVGFVAFTNAVTAVADCTASTVLYCNEAKTFPANASCAVEAIYCKDWASITVPSTTTLSIGDGTNPGMILMAGQRGIYGGGTLDFRGAQAMLVGGGSGSESYNGTVAVKITNVSSVNYLATIDEASSYRKLALTMAQDYPCETYVSAVRIFAQNTNCFSSGRVHVMGGLRKGGQIDFRTAGTWPNAFTVRGAGLSNTEWDSTESVWGTAALSFYTNATLAGDVTVDDSARFSARANVTGTFAGVVSGGRVHLYKTLGEIAFANHNTYVGGTLVDGGTFTLAYGDSAGTGAVTLANTYGTAVLNFANAPNVTFTNEVNGSGEIRISGMGAVAFTGAWAANLPFRRLGPGTVLTLNKGAFVAASSTLVPAFDGDADLGGQTYAVAGVCGTGTISHGTLNVAAGGIVSPGGEGALGALHFAEGVLVPAGAITYVCELGAEGSDELTIDGDFAATQTTLAVRSVDGATLPKRAWAGVLSATGTLTLPFAAETFPRHAMYSTSADDAVTIVNPYTGGAIILR